MPRTNPRRARLSKFTRSRVFVGAIAVLVVAFGLALVPSPYDVFAPGSAVDLGRVVAVEGRRPPPRRFFLTDVSVTRASLLLLAWGLWPGVRLVPVDEVVPAGIGRAAYERTMEDAMTGSQRIAEYVAERAAGLAVAPLVQHVVVAGFAHASRADGSLALGDEIARIDSIRISTARDIAIALRRTSPGTPVDVVVRRDGRAVRARVVTSGAPGRARLGVAIAVRTEDPNVPVPVRFSIDRISGSSAGLMFALEIYAALHAIRPGPSVAGTGTLAPDGSVGPIEGVRQKLEAARRAGARLFVVPKQNYAAVASERDIEIRPVATFAEALAAVRSP